MKQTGINMEMVKKKNRASILNFINQSGPISRKDIANALGLTPAAVTQICADLIMGGLLMETGTVVSENRAGRKKVLVDINYEFKAVFGINIESERTVIALTNLNGEAKLIRALPTEKKREPKSFLLMVADCCMQMLKDAHLTLDAVAGIGVGITGIVNHEEGISVHAYGIWQEEVPIREILNAYFKVPVVVENNVIAFSLAELLYGVGKEKDNLLFVKWGPGVGSAIIADKKVYEGRKGKAAELGHFIVDKNGKQCSCGRRGCLETKISYAAIAEQFEKVFSKKDTPKLYEKMQGDFGNFNREYLMAHINELDAKLLNMLDDMLDLFARAIVNCITILAPNRVVLCGALFQNEVLRSKIIEDCSCYEPKYNGNKIIHTMLSEREDYIGPAALIVGAYMYGFDSVK